MLTAFVQGLKTGFLGFDIQNRSAMIWDSGDKTFTLTNLSTVGKAVVAVLQNAAEYTNKYVYVGSVTTSQNEILAALQKKTAKNWEGMFFQKTYQR